MSYNISVSFSPHIQDRMSISSMTYTTMAALLPALLFGFYFYGLRAIIIVALGVVSAVLSEAGIQKVMGRPVAVKDGTAALTGLLLAMLLPATTPWWAVIVGSFVAIFLGKQVFGGLGGNPFNSVLVGWVVLRLSWPAAVGLFSEPVSFSGGWGSLFLMDDSELPLGILKYGDNGGIASIYGLWPGLIGSVPGGVGSTSVLALLAGGLYLIYRRIINWPVPVGFLGGLFLFGLIFWLTDSQGDLYANPVYHLIYGYTMIGAFFLATDSTTSPYTFIGGLVYGIGAGVLTMIIRYWGAYQDGVIFALLFLNALTPVLDRLKTKSYGLVKAS
jgi:Na+-translocating ferredoxin:NAD+ oxidoreductase subunit D